MNKGLLEQSIDWAPYIIGFAVSLVIIGIIVELIEKRLK